MAAALVAALVHLPSLAFAQAWTCPDYLERSGNCPDKPIDPDSPGTIHVTSRPSSAEVVVNGESKGRTPVNLSKVAPGVYDLEARLPDHEVWERQVLVRPGESVKVSATLCSRGKKPATPGICCWPGQRVDGGTCAGAPSCPIHYQRTDHGDSCELVACESGQVRMKSGACCWPGQSWDRSRFTCAGRPASCPGKRIRTWNDCVRPPSMRDDDGDGSSNAEDKCPGKPEDPDHFRDGDGCPDPDNDGDGIADRDDNCPVKPEDKDDFADSDGCPDPDNDADEVPDASDACPRTPEDRDGFEDDDGCPDLDHDGDGIAQGRDRCPEARETDNGYKDADGCPDSLPLLVAWGSDAGHRAGYSFGVATSLPGESGAGVTHAITLRMIGGLEGGGRFLASSETRTAQVFVGLAPLHLGMWIQRKGGSSLILAEPFVHLAAYPGGSSWPTSLVVGNRVTWRGKSWWGIEVGYATGNDAVSDGLQVAIQANPNLDWEGGRLSRPLGLRGDFWGIEGSGAISAAGRAVITWQGLGVGILAGRLQVSRDAATPGMESRSLFGPTVELSPLRFGTGFLKGEAWSSNIDWFDPFISSNWFFGLDRPPNLVTGLRLNARPGWATIGPTVIYRLASDVLPSGFGFGFQVAIERSR